MLNKHKNYVSVGITALGVLSIFVMMFLSTTVTFFGGGIGPNQFEPYGLKNAQLASAPAFNGMSVKQVTVEVENKDQSKAANGFGALGNALNRMNAEEQTIFNVRAVSEDASSAKLEFMFQSLSPSDYESDAFQRAYVPFSRLASSPGFSGVKYLSTINESGERHVTVETEVNSDTLVGSKAENFWRSMMIVLAPITENTSYDVTLKTAKGITIHSTLSTDAEQKKMIEVQPNNNNWDGVFAMTKFGNVASIDLYVHGLDPSKTTVAVTLPENENASAYAKNLTAYAANEENKFPRDYTTTVTVEGQSTPAFVLPPQR